MRGICGRAETDGEGGSDGGVSDVVSVSASPAAAHA
jgi:hypothetical protein